MTAKPAPAPVAPMAITMREVKMLVTDQAIIVRRSGELAFTRGAQAKADEATLLLFDPKIGAFRPVLTPPGTAWELVEKRQGPQLWKPGQPT